MGLGAIYGFIRFHPSAETLPKRKRPCLQLRFSDGTYLTVVISLFGEIRVFDDVEKAAYLAKRDERIVTPDSERFTLEGFAVMGVIGHFASAAENFDPLWEREYMSFHEQIEPLSAGEGYYGVYLGADHAKPIDYLAGMAVQGTAGAPEGVEVREVPAALYAVFECSFQAIGPTYGYIWGEWLQSSAYEQDTSKLGFDYFPPGTTDGDSPMEIWFPVREKEGSSR